MQSGGILEEIVARLDRIEAAIATKASPTIVNVAPTNGASASEEDEPRRKRGRPRNDATEKELTQDQIKTKLKAVLEKKGRSTAMAILEEFDAEKIGEIDKDQYAAFSKACDKALATEESDDLDLD